MKIAILGLKVLTDPSKKITKCALRHGILAQDIRECQREQRRGWMRIDKNSPIDFTIELSTALKRKVRFRVEKASERHTSIYVRYKAKADCHFEVIQTQPSVNHTPQ